MRTIKVIISYILITALLLISVGATEGDPTESTGYTPEEKALVEKLVCLGVIEQTNKNLYEDVTRADMAKIVVDYLNVSDYDMGGGSALFIDVTSSTDGSHDIALLYDLGYISGSGDNLYHPLRATTLDEAMAFIINAMGYGFKAKTAGVYPVGYRKVASENHLYTGVTPSKTKVSFIDVYKIIENSLDIPAVVLDAVTKNDEAFAVDKNHTILNEFHKIYKKTGIMTGDEFTKLVSHKTNLSGDQVEIDGVTYATEYNCDEYLGSCVNYYYKRDLKNGNALDTVIYMEVNSARNNQIVVDAEYVVREKTTNRAVYYRDEDNDLQNIEIKTNVNVIVNGMSYLGYGMLKNAIPEYGILKFIDNNNDAVIDVLSITSYENVLVKSIDIIKGEIVDKVDDSVLKFNPDRDRITIINDSDGTEAKLSDIQLWDVLTVSESKNSTGTKKLVIRIVRDTVTGRVESLGTHRGKTVMKINENEYRFAPGCEETMSLGQRGTFYLDYMGNIVYFRSGEDEGRVYGIFYASGDSGNGFSSDLQYKVFDETGTWNIYTVNNRVKVDGKTYDIEDTDGYTYVKNMFEQGELFRYSLSSNGKINMIDSKKPDGTLAGSLKEIYSADKLGQRDGLFFNMDDGFHFATNTETVFFSIPEDIKDETSYKIVTRGAFTPETTHNYPYKVYTIDESVINLATAMVVTGISGSALSDATKFSVIKDFYESVDSEGFVRTEIIFTSGETEESVFVSDEVRDSATDTKHPIEYYKLQPNDIIQYGVDDRGMINDILLIYRYDTKNGTLTPGELDPVSGYVDNRYNDTTKVIDANGRHIYATVDAVENGILKFSTTAISESQLCYVGSTAVYKLSKNNDDGKPVPSSLNSLKKGDKIVARLQCLVAREIFIIE